MTSFFVLQRQRSFEVGWDNCPLGLKSIREVLALQKLVQNVRDAELSVFRMPFRWIRVGRVLADAVTTAYFFSDFAARLAHRLTGFSSMDARCLRVTAAAI